MVKVRVAVSALLAAVLAVGIAGCSFTNGEQTLPRNYDPSDGVGANVGQLAVRNALLVSGGGSRATIVASVVNDTDTQQQLSIQYASKSAGRSTITASIPSHTVITFSYGKGSQVVLEGVDATPGALFPVYFASGNAEGAQLRLPVLDTTLAEYNGFRPTPTPTPTPAATPLATPGPTPTPSPTP